MNEENQNPSNSLVIVTCFHVDVEKWGHHEMNGVLEKNGQLMQKNGLPYIKQMRGRNGSQLLHIQSCSKMILCFVMCVATWIRKVHLKM
jgi:hypothetical protein